MLSQELEETLRRSMKLAEEKGHEFATLEHLLVALTEDSEHLKCSPPVMSISTPCGKKWNATLMKLSQGSISKPVRPSRPPVSSVCFSVQ